MTAENTWMQLRSRDYGAVFDKPFPVGTEYYRPPTPTREFWDGDFRRISAAGMSIVRVWYSWNWVETLPNRYEFDDLDLLFDTAAKHRLKVWLDTPLPIWPLRPGCCASTPACARSGGTAACRRTQPGTFPPTAA
ncbi:MAG: beta-galactosidase [Gemmatimonadetes bacterium]|nr:beta-galactosidase [Gemmatimonadota bacterium]